MRIVGIGLTGLPNRRAFTDLIEGLFSERRRPPRVRLFIDLDDFKLDNDSLGHAAGDELLRLVARRLMSVALEGETVARLGGDEFAIVLNAEGQQAAVAVAQRTLAVLQDPLVISGTVVTVGCSIGVAISDAEVGVSTAGGVGPQRRLCHVYGKESGQEPVRGVRLHPAPDHTRRSCTQSSGASTFSPFCGIVTKGPGAAGEGDCGSDGG